MLWRYHEGIIFSARKDDAFFIAEGVIMKKNSILKLVYAAVCLALAMVLPFLTGQIPQIGSALCPMHIAIFICGFVCGGQYGMIIGFVATLLRFALFGMPPIFPTGIAMAFELAAYGLISGVLYRMLPKKIPYIYVSLIGAMIGGRIVWGIAQFIIMGLQGSEFPMSAFLAGAVTNAIPGIILHIAFIPVVVITLRKANIIVEETGHV